MISAAANAVSAEVPSAEKIKQVAQSSYWKRLLHYRKGWLWGERSEADGDEFFLSPQGQTDPEAELLADIRAFQNPEAIKVGELQQHPQCAFPERLRFLKEELRLTLPTLDCPDFTTWKSRFNARSISLVYAAAYFGSPSSMFGHTFLRIDSAPRNAAAKKNDLLDYGISFDAVMNSGSTLAYPIKGLLGMFPGTYSQMPFFVKINSYVNMENRDLWEYQLNLNPDPLDRLLSHIWEMGTTHFNYYFLNRNCSYQLLALFEVANPDWNLKNQFAMAAIPVDTIRAVLKQKDSLRSVHYRPSQMHVLERRLALLNSQELERFYLLKNDVSLARENDSANTLDALMDWQKYQALKSSLNIDEAEKKIDLHLLQLRAKLEETSVEAENLKPSEWPTRPDQGHASSKFSTYLSSEGSASAIGIEVRPGFHDLLDSEKGFLPNSALNLARLRVSVLTDGSSVRLDEFLLGEVKTYQPWTRLKKYLSWALIAGGKRPVDTLCTSCFAEYFRGEAGLTLGNTKASISFMGTGQSEFSGFYNSIMGQNYRIGPGAMLLGLFTFSDRLKFLASYEHTRYFPGPDQHYLSKTEIALSYNLPLELRLQVDSYASPWQNFNVGVLTLGFYF